jgi:hypothetical protein
MVPDSKREDVMCGTQRGFSQLDAIRTRRGMRKDNCERERQSSKANAGKQTTTCKNGS